MSINSVGGRIRALRKEQKLTLKDLSEKANISVSFLSDIENSRSNPSLERLNDIAIALATTAAQLIGQDAEFNNFEMSKDTSEETLLQSMGRSCRLNKKDEKDISKILKQTREQLENSEGLMFDGEPATPEAIESILEAMEIGMGIAKKKNKEKYTPKKYNKKDK